MRRTKKDRSPLIKDCGMYRKNIEYNNLFTAACPCPQRSHSITPSGDTRHFVSTFPCRLINGKIIKCGKVAKV